MKLHPPDRTQDRDDAFGSSPVDDVDIAEIVRQHLLGDETAVDSGALDQLLQPVAGQSPVKPPQWNRAAKISGVRRI